VCRRVDADVVEVHTARVRRVPGITTDWLA
jgi:hypothetical protein